MWFKVILVFLAVLLMGVLSIGVIEKSINRLLAMDSSISRANYYLEQMSPLDGESHVVHVGKRNFLRYFFLNEIKIYKTSFFSKCINENKISEGCMFGRTSQENIDFVNSFSWKID